MLYRPGPITGAQSGSIGAMTASRNKGGTYYRTRAIPINPQTPPQQTVRSIFSQLSIRWTQTLTQAQRDGWTALSEQQTFLNRIGDARNIPPLSCYQKANAARNQGGLGIVDDAPTLYLLEELSAFPNASGFVAGPPSEVDIDFDNGDEWATAVGGGLMVYASAPKNVTINFFKGPYRLCGTILGAVIPPTSPATVTLALPAVAGQRIYFRFIAVNADGRVSPFMTTVLDT